MLRFVRISRPPPFLPPDATEFFKPAFYIPEKT